MDRMNAAQLVLGASAQLTVGVAGGTAVLASLVSTKLLMLCRSGHECDNDFQNLYRFNNATIVVSSSEAVLIQESASGCPAAGGGAFRASKLISNFRFG
mmetsp:Transcript_16003/g.34760  ORF Transcript_16003/g.34760 Transcript_16003/m.34760 type:complete len:99 (-) Transcript_16003:171-467(-)